MPRGDNNKGNRRFPTKIVGMIVPEVRNQQRYQNPSFLKRIRLRRAEANHETLSFIKRREGINMPREKFVKTKRGLLHWEAVIKMLSSSDD